jgi:aspartyl-tRNA(Asn)/glutamyl-tRNA(Gln) amidotransferase subunit A
LQTDLTLAQWSKAQHTGQLTSTELTAIMLERIEITGDTVFTRIFREQALSAALAADKRWSKGVALSPIDGVPIAVKDLFDIEGFTTRAGSVALADAPVANSDAMAVQRLKQAGAVVLGLTNMTEFA